MLAKEGAEGKHRVLVPAAGNSAQESPEPKPRQSRPDPIVYPRMNPPAGSHSATGLSRRRFSTGIMRAGLAWLAMPAAFRLPGRAAVPTAAPSVLIGGRPEITHGVMSGDVTAESAVIWSRTTRPARMVVEWSLNEAFRGARRLEGPVTGSEADFTAKTLLTGLPAGQRVFYRVRFEDRGTPGEAGPASSGQLLTAPRDRRNILFAWSGDTAGQGYGIDAAFGGMRTYASLKAAQPDFFVHSGDTIYADVPLAAELALPNGRTWRNELFPEKTKVAEFRGNHRYNLQDPQVRDCYAHVPMLAQWDDHEVRNNWYPGQKLNEDPRYTEKSVDVLAAHARRAFLDYMPIRPSANSIIYRSVARGPLCDLFFLDLRSYRGPNGANRQPVRSREADFMGGTQLEWLKRSMKASRALWKVVCTDMPLALLVGDGVDRWEAWANGDHGVPLGRELEIADLLAFLKAHSIRNVIFLTADVHYAASHRYDPSRARFTEFNPFWEFVSGPMHAMSLSAGTLDRTFGPEAVWSSRPAGSVPSGPFSPEQYFGTVGIDGRSGALTVTHFDREGTRLTSTTLEAHPG